MRDGASDYLSCLVAIIITFLVAYADRDLLSQRKSLETPFFFLIIKEGQGIRHSSMYIW